jgi:hypothetical protein
LHERNAHSSSNRVRVDHFAQHRLDSTDSPMLSAGWTLRRMPRVSVPFGHGPHGLQLCLEVIGQRVSGRGRRPV